MAVDDDGRAIRGGDGVDLRAVDAMRELIAAGGVSVKTLINTEFRYLRWSLRSLFVTLGRIGASIGGDGGRPQGCRCWRAI